MGVEKPPEKTIDSQKRGLIKPLNCKYEIYIATRELDAHGDGREAGLLICAGPFSVLDCTLFDLGGKVASKFFGTIILSGHMREICKHEKIVDEKRETGILKKTPLYENLSRVFHPKLELLIEKERRRLSKKTSEVSEGIIENKLDLIKEFNKIARQEETNEITEIKGDYKFDPGPNGIRFCVPEDYLKLTEKQEREVHIVVDTTMIPNGSEIEIKQDKEGISVDPKNIRITEKETDNKGRFRTKISFKSDATDYFLITAYVKGMLNKAKLNIDVIKDPRLYIKNPIEFVPSEQDIVMKKKKDFSLIIDFSRANKNETISFSSDNIFSINQKPKLSDAKQICGDFYELTVPIYCEGKPKQKGVVTAEIGENIATLNLEVIHSKDKYLKGKFEGFDEDKEDNPDDVSYYDNKIIYIFVNHQILKHYRRGMDAEKSTAYRVLFSDILIKEFCKELTRDKIKTTHYQNPEEYRVKFDGKYNELYKKNSARLHSICINPENLEKLKVK